MSEPNNESSPQSILVRALELRVRRQKAHEAYQKASDLCFDHNTAANHEIKSYAYQDWQAAYEDYRQYLVSVGASNLDEVVNRANLAAREA